MAADLGFNAPEAKRMWATLAKLSVISGTRAALIADELYTGTRAVCLAAVERRCGNIPKKRRSSGSQGRLLQSARQPCVTQSQASLAGLARVRPIGRTIDHVPDGRSLGDTAANWHIDMPPVDPLIAVRSFAYISPVRRCGGGTLIVAGSHLLAERCPGISSAGVPSELAANSSWFRQLWSGEPGPERTDRYMAGDEVDGVQVRVCPAGEFDLAFAPAGPCRTRQGRSGAAGDRRTGPTVGFDRLRIDQTPW